LASDFNDLWNLRRLHLFAGLDTETIDEILQIVTVRSVPHDEIIYRLDEARERLYFLQHGRIKTYTFTQEGREKILQVLLPGDAFGGLLLGPLAREVPWAQALEDAVICSMDRDAFEHFMRVRPELCMNLFRYMTNRHAADLNRLQTLIHTRTSHRLVLTLLEFGARLGQEDAQQFELDPSLTHEELANLIGAARTTVSELITQLRKQGVLGGEGRTVIVHRAAAEQFLQGNV